MNLPSHNSLHASSYFYFYFFSLLWSDKQYWTYLDIFCSEFMLFFTLLDMKKINFKVLFGYILYYSYIY